jgi:hypothetical protein
MILLEFIIFTTVLIKPVEIPIWPPERFVSKEDCVNPKDDTNEYAKPCKFGRLTCVTDRVAVETLLPAAVNLDRMIQGEYPKWREETQSNNGVALVIFRSSCGVGRVFVPHTGRRGILWWRRKLLLLLLFLSRIAESAIPAENRVPTEYRVLRATVVIFIIRRSCRMSPGTLTTRAVVIENSAISRVDCGRPAFR